MRPVVDGYLAWGNVGSPCRESRPVTNPFGHSVDETCDVGRDRASPVSPDHPARDNRFTGTVNWLELDADEAALDEGHVLTDAERFTVAMARQ